MGKSWVSVVATAVLATPGFDAAELAQRAAADGQTSAYKNAFGKNIGRYRLAVSVSKSF